MEGCLYSGMLEIVAGDEIVMIWVVVLRLYFFFFDIAMGFFLSDIGCAL